MASLMPMVVHGFTARTSLTGVKHNSPTGPWRPAEPAARSVAAAGPGPLELRVFAGAPGAALPRFQPLSKVFGEPDG